MSEATQHLGSHRRLILGRALLAGAAGLVPVPYLDDLLAGGVRSQLLRRLAELNHVDLDANAVAAPTTSKPLAGTFRANAAPTSMAQSPAIATPMRMKFGDYRQFESALLEPGAGPEDAAAAAQSLRAIVARMRGESPSETLVGQA